MKEGHLPESIKMYCNFRVGFPDPVRSYTATHLACITDWHCNKQSILWISIEQDYLPFLIEEAPWAGPPGQRQAKYPSIGSMLKAFLPLMKKWGIPVYTLPMTTIIGHPNLFLLKQ